MLRNDDWRRQVMVVVMLCVKVSCVYNSIYDIWKLCVCVCFCENKEAISSACCNFIVRVVHNSEIATLPLINSAANFPFLLCADSVITGNANNYLHHERTHLYIMFHNPTLHIHGISIKVYFNNILAIDIVGMSHLHCACTFDWWTDRWSTRPTLGAQVSLINCRRRLFKPRFKWINMIWEIIFVLGWRWIFKIR